MSIFDVLDINKEKSYKINGVVSGTVKENYDSEGNYPGMVKVQLNTMQNNLNETGWIRVASLSAGDKKGIYFLPEVGEEVLVTFFDGDPNRPVVIGSLWNSEKLHPEKTVTEKNTIKSVRTPKGHEITFDEEDGKEKITVNTPKKLTVFMDDENQVIDIKDEKGENKLTINAKEGHITISSKKKITVDANGTTVEIDGEGKEISLKAGKININGDQEINIKTNNLKIEGAMAEIKASSTLDIKSSGPANIKGAMVKIN